MKKWDKPELFLLGVEETKSNSLKILAGASYFANGNDDFSSSVDIGFSSSEDCSGGAASSSTTGI